LVGLKVGVQGVGHVGYYLCKYLAENGAKLFITDIDTEALKRVVDDFGADVIGLDDIYSADLDIYAPCALGATLNDDTIPQLKCSIVAGAANNQLKDDTKHAQMLKDRGILYAPDYAINSGGLINVANEIEGYNRERAFRQAEGIYDMLMKIYSQADIDGVTTHEAASKVAEQRMREVGKLKNVYLPKKNVMGRRDNA
jgi:leucine dehydrogenase